MTPTERADWLAWRRKGLGGTDVSAILGRHPHRTAWDVWLDKVHGATMPDSPEMEMGRALEDVVIRWAAEDLQGEPMPAERLEDRVGGILRGSPDGRIVFRDVNPIGIEAKTARYPDAEAGWGPDRSGQIPEHYQDQVQTYMLLDRVSTWVVAVWFLAAYDRRLYFIEADPVRQLEIAEAVLPWWERHVVGGEPPDVDESTACAQWLRGQHPRGRGLRPASDREAEVARTLAEIEAQIGDLDQSRAELRNWLRSAIGDAEGLYFRDGRATWSRKSNRLTVRMRA